MALSFDQGIVVCHIVKAPGEANSHKVKSETLELYFKANICLPNKETFFLAAEGVTATQRRGRWNRKLNQT